MTDTPEWDYSLVINKLTGEIVVKFNLQQSLFMLKMKYKLTCNSG
jgi:hypothetical protein